MNFEQWILDNLFTLCGTVTRTTDLLEINQLKDFQKFEFFRWWYFYFQKRMKLVKMSLCWINYEIKPYGRKSAQFKRWFFNGGISLVDYNLKHILDLLPYFRTMTLSVKYLHIRKLLFYQNFIIFGTLFPKKMARFHICGELVIKLVDRKVRCCPEVPTWC